jgi:redox-sensitive bicupin YhaK (pirin superfamily)
MKKVIHLAETRGFADLGWLKTHHTFSFANYYDPERVRFGLLRVLNDDWIDPGKGFDFHQHDNMEIITIPLTGSIRHKDSLGNEFVIKSGEIQRMSAGSGIVHSEYSDSKDEISNLLQIWVFPKIKDIDPRYGQKTFEISGRKDIFQLIISPDGRDGSIEVNQDAFFSLSNLGQGKSLKYQVNIKGNGLYLFVISGSIEVLEETLNSRDGMGISEVSEISIKAKKDSEILVMEIPLK